MNGLFECEESEAMSRVLFSCKLYSCHRQLKLLKLIRQLD